MALTDSPRWTAGRFLVVAGTVFLLYRAVVRLAPFAPAALQITFFDVGQGDSTLLQFPNGDRWLVDGGGAFLERQIGRELFAELSMQGLLSFENIVLSHPDADHGEGLLELLSQLHVANFLYNPAAPIKQKRIKPLLADLIARAHLLRTTVRPFRFPQSQQRGGVQVALHPLKGKTANDQALVLRLQYGNCSALLTGDIEKDGEAELVKASRDWPATRELTVLKVAHHGSRTSSTPNFLRRFAPRFAVISSGVTNRYGHPNSGVLDRLRQTGAHLLRTDFHGWVRFTITADSRFTCESSRGECGEGFCF